MKDIKIYANSDGEHFPEVVRPGYYLAGVDKDITNHVNHCQKCYFNAQLLGSRNKHTAYSIKLTVF